MGRAEVLLRCMATSIYTNSAAPPTAGALSMAAAFPGASRTLNVRRHQLLGQNLLAHSPAMANAQAVAHPDHAFQREQSCVSMAHAGAASYTVRFLACLAGTISPSCAQSGLLVMMQKGRSPLRFFNAQIASVPMILSCCSPMCVMAPFRVSRPSRKQVSEAAATGC